MLAATLVLTATVYSNALAGRPVSGGGKYDPKKLTVATNDLPLHTKILVCGAEVCSRAEVTDRMARQHRIDLSEALSRKIKTRAGKVRVYTD